MWTRGCVDLKGDNVEFNTCGLEDDVEFRRCGLGDMWT